MQNITFEAVEAGKIEETIRVERVEITSRKGRGTVESIIHHTAIELTAVDPATDTRVKVTHKARRFERVVGCPDATAELLAATARSEFPRAVVELRFA